MYSSLALALALAHSSALLAPRAPVAARGVSLYSTPPALSYAADKAKDAPEEEITDASFVGQYLCTNQPVSCMFETFVPSAPPGTRRCP